jgi:Ser/Thr protein kinase RdoA (MazF antagonist)
MGTRSERSRKVCVRCVRITFRGRASAATSTTAHGQSVEFYSGQWSHGDPHLGNFLFDPAGARCRLIDFEVTHHRSLTPEERHTDDLLVPLLDLCGRLENEAWVPMALSFLAGYDNPELLKRLKERLRVPRGMPRLWWAIRTSYIGRPVLTRRLETLRAALP